MIKHSIACDNTGKYHARYEPGYGTDVDELARSQEGWFQAEINPDGNGGILVSAIEDIPSSEAKHFCSFDCLSRWLESELDPVKPIPVAIPAPTSPIAVNSKPVEWKLEQSTESQSNPTKPDVDKFMNEDEGPEELHIV